MARLGNIQIQNTTRQKLLHFGTKIVNVGAGDFQAHGERSSTAQATMTDVEQRMFDSAGGHRDVQATGAEMYYGHDHWHVRNLEVYILTRLSDAGEPVAKGNKQGFCFYDNVNWGSSQPAFYGTDTSPYGVGCSNGQPGTLDVTVWLSRGWGDNYSWNTVGRSVTITGLPEGTYRLTATADSDNWFVESANANNDTWVDIRIAVNTVNVLGYGPSSPQVSG